MSTSIVDPSLQKTTPSPSALVQRTDHSCEVKLRLRLKADFGPTWTCKSPKAGETAIHPTACMTKFPAAHFSCAVDSMDGCLRCLDDIRRFARCRRAAHLFRPSRTWPRSSCGRGERLSPPGAPPRDFSAHSGCQRHARTNPRHAPLPLTTCPVPRRDASRQARWQAQPIPSSAPAHCD